jgi:hypothetical protein
VVYLAQQIQQFRLKGEEFAMQHLGSETEMRQALREVVASILREGGLTDPERRDLLASLPAEERLRGLPAEERLRGLPAEERLRGLSPEEQLAALSPEALAALRQRLREESPPTPPG